MDSWSELSMKDKAAIMKMAVEGGVYDLESIRSAYNEYRNGGGIHIDPSKKGTFTAAASRHGKSVQAFASQVLANKDDYSAAMVKKANFARNAAKWHSLGGYLDNEFDMGGDKEELPPIVPFDRRMEVIITPDSAYNQYLNTLPDNQRFTPNDKYDSYLYWKLNGKPKDFSEAYDKGMFHFDNSDKSYHANSIAWGDDGVGYFMKPKTHDTVGYELDWFNKGLVTEEGGWQRPETFLEWKESQPFRESYKLIDDPNRPNYYRYQPVETTPVESKSKKKALGGPIVERAGIYAHGGELGNYYDGFGDAWNFLKRGVQKAREKVHDWGLDKSPAEHIIEWITPKETEENAYNGQQEDTLLYRNRPAERVVTNPFEKDGRLVPLRLRENTSKTTKKESEELENKMRSHLANKDASAGSSNPAFDIPYIPEKSILINGSTTSTNVLDSLAKYAGIHNRNPQLSQYPMRKRSLYGKPREVNLDEMLGLSTQETHNGAMPAYNFAESNDDRHKALNIDYRDYNRALGNANYFTAFGYIPAEYLVRNFQYNNANVDRETPPLLDAFRFYAQGNYNTGESDHTANVNNAGKKAWKNPEVRKWWELSGKYWYNNGKGPNK